VAISAVHDWLRTNGDFAAGVALLNRYAKPPRSVAFLLSLGDKPHVRKALCECLERINAVSDTRIPEPPPKAAPSAIHEPQRLAMFRANSQDGGRGDDTKLPPDLQRTREELKALHRHESYLRGQLVLLPDGEELAICANKVVEVYNRKKKGWFRIETWRATGDVPAEKLDIPKDRGALILERNSIRAQLSKVKHGKTKPDPVRDEKYRKRLAELQSQIDAPVEA